MFANELLDELEQFGGVPLIMGVDQEGNGYNHVRGIDMVWATKDFDGVYDTLGEIHHHAAIPVSTCFFQG